MIRQLIVCVAIGLFLTACAFDLVNIKHSTTKFQITEELQSSFELQEEISVGLVTGYSIILKKGTQWNHIGSIPEGDVFKTDDQVLTVEASNIYEAYVVVSSTKLLGFYLPVESSYAPLSEPEELKVRLLTRKPMNP